MKLDASYRGNDARELIACIVQVETTIRMLNPRAGDRRFTYKLMQNKDEITIAAELI